MAILLFSFLIAFFKITPAKTPGHTDQWVLWNVGQGQWLTHIESESCTHYDVGGEFGSFSLIKRALVLNCGEKKNRLNLSHWDYDHFINIPMLARTVPRLCWNYHPPVVGGKKSARKILDLKIPFCTNLERPWRPPPSKNTNASSAVFLKKSVLIPGDSPKAQEKFWLREIVGLNLTRVLIVGHHGSRTSTGEPLLNSLPALQQALASARFAKYRHPHPEVQARLRAAAIPLIGTEVWGNIWFTPK